MELKRLCEKLDRRLSQLDVKPWVEGEALVDRVTLGALRVEDLEAEVLPRLVDITRRDAQLHGFSLPKAAESLREVLTALSRNAREERPPRLEADSEPDSHRDRALAVDVPFVLGGGQRPQRAHPR